MRQEELVTKVLRAKEERYTLQNKLIDGFDRPLISFTLVLPGGYFNYRGWETLFKLGTAQIKSDLGNSVLYKEERVGDWGPEAFFVVDMKVTELKRVAVEIEEGQEIGRLWDVDVIDRDKTSLSRQVVALPLRQCLICERPAIDCYRNATHSFHALQSKAQELVNLGIAGSDRDAISN